MDKSTLIQAMKDSISEVLEQMFFMPVEFTVPVESSADPETGPASIIARIEFSGLSGGSFVLLIPDVSAWSVSADFLGATSQNLTTGQVEGTVLEMVNMLAGTTLSRYDHKALFELQIPELITVDDLRDLTKNVSDYIVIRIQTPDSQMTFMLILK